MERYFLICALGIATAGAVNDVRSGRIPNWLTYVGMLAAFVVRFAFAGWHGLETGLLGWGITGGFFLLLFVIGGMGGGDVKLMAAVGAWAGSGQALTVLVTAAIAGGILAVCYVIFHKQVFQTIRNSMQLVFHHATSGLRPHPLLNVSEASTIRVPYGLAIAMGTLYCAGNAFWWR